MLMRVKRLNWNANYAYAPPAEDAVINTEHVVSAVSVEARGIGPFTELRFTDGSHMTVRGEPGDFVLGGDPKRD